MLPAKAQSARTGWDTRRPEDFVDCRETGNQVKHVHVQLRMHACTLLGKEKEKKGKALLAWFSVGVILGVV